MQGGAREHLPNAVLTPTALTCVFKAVSTIVQPTADPVTLATFTVSVNDVHLHQQWCARMFPQLV